MKKKKLCAHTMNHLISSFTGGGQISVSPAAVAIRNHALLSGFMSDGAGRLFDPELDNQNSKAHDETMVKYACFTNGELSAQGVVPLRSEDEDDAFDMLYQAIDNGMGSQFEIA